MDNSWENVEPAPIEFMHGRMMDLFHEWRRARTSDVQVSMNGTDLANIIAKAKMETYEKYKALDLRKAIPKSKLQNQEPPEPIGYCNSCMKYVPIGFCSIKNCRKL